MANCLASEVPISLDMLEESIDFIIKGKRNIDRFVRESWNYTYNGSVYDIILKSKYGERYSSIVNNRLFENFDKNYLYEYCEAWIRTNCRKEITLKEIERHFNSEEKKDYIKGSLLMMHYSFRMAPPMKNQKKRELEQGDENRINMIFNKVYELLKTNDELNLFVATWCLAWSGYNASDVIPENLHTCLFERLIELWISDFKYNVLERSISWALRTIAKPNFAIKSNDKLIECIERKYNYPKNEFDTDVSIMLAYLSGYCNVKETVKRIKHSAKNICRFDGFAQFWKDVSNKSKLIDKEFKRINDGFSKYN